MITQAEIDALLDAMQVEFEKTGDDADRPGLITFQSDDWIGFDLPTCCTAIWRGIRYRGIRVTISRERETRVWTHGEALAAGERLEHLEDLKSVQDAAI
ncbi:hypothetical protein [Caulobacter sp. RHG1]|uniref:hypothetical protein n=1 Tax=Caulobacter sp. (strain RHG1) TaxID=2545762 RepID=UPI00155427BF|nr:hypothetical protein [Caulobacter sp. RHG1]NQE61512.1 hypothetical protein [Caulobacter sp. RHG1]